VDFYANISKNGSKFRGRIHIKGGRAWIRGGHALEGGVHKGARRASMRAKNTCMEEKKEACMDEGKECTVGEVVTHG
jgi:hypothetical protein